MWLAKLRRYADAADRIGILTVLRALVPTYQVPINVAEGLAARPAERAERVTPRVAANGSSPSVDAGPPMMME
jgi:hypothetical protein